MSEIVKEGWGSLDTGEAICCYTLRNDTGVQAKVTNYGGRLVSLKTPDRDGRFADIVLGFENLAGYLGKNPYFGALVGRYANRIANASFSLNGQTYTLARNNGENALHGGLRGFDKVIWDSQPVAVENGSALELSYLSADGEEGYPGNLQVTVRYTLSDHDELRIDYRATTDQDTVLNLTNHSYFDLGGTGSGDILDLVVTIDADRFTPINQHLIPTGELRPVDGTPFDFRRPIPIGTHIDDSDEQLKLAAGYDHNFVLNARAGEPSFAARAFDPKSGRVLEVATTQPGLQFYTGNHLDGSTRGKGTVYEFRTGVCFETQHFPDSPNQPAFPSTRLAPGGEFRASTVFAFKTEWKPGAVAGSLTGMSDPKSKDTQPDKDLADAERSVPSQAEGDRETVEEDLEEKEQQKPDTSTK